METSVLRSVTSLLADPEKKEITCADGLSLLVTVNKAFRDGVNGYRPGSIAGDEDEQSTDAQAPAPPTSCLRRTITDAIKQKVERNWSVPAGVLNAGESVVTLRIQLGPDGSVRRVEIVDDGGGAYYRTMAESGRRAVLKASPFDALTRHVDKYECWREIIMTFSPPV